MSQRFCGVFGSVLGAMLALQAVGVAQASPPSAESSPVAEQVSPADLAVASLMAAGYQIALRERTFLGRVRIVAVQGRLRREIVLNPGTGEVLRDYAVEIGDNAPGEGAIAQTSPVPTLGVSTDPLVGTVVLRDGPGAVAVAPPATLP